MRRWRTGTDTNTATTIIQTSADVWRPSQSAWLELKCFSTPMSCRNTLTTPLPGSSAHRKISAVITTDAAHGAMSAQRASRRPGKRWLNNCATASEIAIVTVTTSTTHTAVRNSTADRSGSSNRFE